jgi:uncharacterized paraquat-inducible protein A
MYIKCQRCNIRKHERVMRHHKEQILCPFCHVEILHEEDTRESREKDNAAFLFITAFIILTISIVSGFCWSFNHV